jgi:hypothetical protein
LAFYHEVASPCGRNLPVDSLHIWLPSYTLEPLATDKKLAFKVEVSPKMPAGYGDGRRLTQVLMSAIFFAMTN